MNIKPSIPAKPAKPLVSQGFCGTHEINKSLKDGVQLGGGSHGNFVIPAPVMSFEPWLMGTVTDNPKVSPEHAEKLTDAFGDSAILSIEDERIAGIDGYYFDGWETVGGDDFIKGRTLSRLGEGWEMTEFGEYELKSDNGVSQKLSFRMGVNSTTLESTYVDNTFDTSYVTEILRKSEDGEIRREVPPRGL